LNNEVSHFNQQKKHSNYHFNNSKYDQVGEWFQPLGHFNGAWQAEIKDLISSSKKVNWQNVASVDNPTAPVTEERIERIKAREYDVIQGGGNPSMTLVQADTDVTRFPVFEKMVNYFGLNRAKARAHVQLTGQVFNYHLDVLPHHADVSFDQVIRFVIFLEDWEPGHFYMYGTRTLSHWRAGDFHTFDWQNVPHCTANAGLCPRVSLMITGIKTDCTNQVLSQSFTEITL